MAEDFPPHPETGARAVIPPRIPPVTNNHNGRQRIITPYRSDEFERRLRLNQVLWKKHSELPNRIRYGFPIGDFSPLRRTYVAPNHARRPEHVAFIREYLNEQRELGRMEGPYDEQTVRAKLLSPFMTSPSFVIAKAGSPGKFRLVQDCSYKNEDGFSVNDSVEADKFPTKWDNASSVAQIVSASAYIPSHEARLLAPYDGTPIHWYRMLYELQAAAITRTSMLVLLPKHL